MGRVAAETILGAMEFLVATSKTSGCDPFAQLDNTSRLAKIKESGKDNQPNGTQNDRQKVGGSKTWVQIFVTGVREAGPRRANHHKREPTTTCACHTESQRSFC